MAPILLLPSCQGSSCHPPTVAEQFSETALPSTVHRTGWVIAAKILGLDSATIVQGVVSVRFSYLAYMNVRHDRTRRSSIKS